VVLALLLRWMLNPVLGDRVVFATLFLVLLPLAWVVRPAPFLVAAFAGLTGYVFFFLSAPREPARGPIPLGVQILLFLALGVALAATAVLARRRHEQLLTSQQLFRSFIDQSPVRAWLKDAEGRYVFLNSGIRDGFGRDRAASLGRTDQELYSPEDARIIRDNDLAVLESGISREFLETVHGAGGGEHHVLAFKFPVPTPGGKLMIGGVGIEMTERIRAERDAARLAAIVQSSEDAIYSRTLDGIVTSWNAAAERIYGYSEQEAVGRHVEFLIPPDHRSEEQQFLARLRRGERIEHFRTKRRTRDGRTIDIALTISPIRDASGQIVGASKIARDITRLKLAEDALLESEQRFRGIFDQAAIGIARAATEGTLLDVNPGLCAMLGHERQELIGTDAANLFHPSDREIAGARLHELREGHQRHATLEARLLPRDGRELWVSISASLIQELPDRPEHIVLIVSDTTAMRSAQQALRNSEELLRRKVDELSTLLNILPVGVWISDPSGERITGNRGVYELFGIPEGGNVSYNSRDSALPPGTRFYRDGRELAREELPLEVVARTRKACHGVEHDIVFADGRRVTIWGNAAPVLDDRSEIRAIIGAFVDFTAHKRAQAELQRYREQLEMLVADRTRELESAGERLRHSERLAALGTLSAGLGHDIANTLLPLRVRLDGLQTRDDLPASAIEELAQIRSLLEYLGSIARGMRMFARDPEQQGVEDRTDLTLWRHDAERFLRASLQAGIRLECVIDPDLPLIPLAPHRLSQAVLNLVNNARDSILTARGPAGAGSIQVLARPSREGVEIAVRDDGAGMSDEIRRRCLEPFFTTKSRGTGGTGLGLSMVYGIIQAAHGSIEIDSSPGSGSVFRMVFPAAAPTARRPMRKVHLTITDGRSRSILRSLLTSMEYEVVEECPTSVPGQTPGARGFWITDSLSATPSQVRDTLRCGSVRNVLTLGGDREWAEAGAFTFPTDAPLSRIRDVLASQP
jgi:PAS domain S-box-containing protein